MSKIESFIIKENNNFYFDFEAYNDLNSDIILECGDVIKFTYNNQKYIGKLIQSFSKNGLLVINLIQ